jgi:hypothetical protein
VHGDGPTVGGASGVRAGVLRAGLMRRCVLRIVLRGAKCGVFLGTTLGILIECAPGQYYVAGMDVSQEVGIVFSAGIWGLVGLMCGAAAGMSRC